MRKICRRRTTSRDRVFLILFNLQVQHGFLSIFHCNNFIRVNANDKINDVSSDFDVQAQFRVHCYTLHALWHKTLPKLVQNAEGSCTKFCIKLSEKKLVTKKATSVVIKLYFKNVKIQASVVVLKQNNIEHTLCNQHAKMQTCQLINLKKDTQKRSRIYR